MNNCSVEASLVTRTVLKEITDNAVAQQRTTPTKRQFASDLNVCGDQIKENSSEVQDTKCSNTDKVNTIVPLEAKNSLEKEKEEAKNIQLCNSSSSILPDIVNVQPSLALASEEQEDSFVSSLVNNFNFLKLDSKVSQLSGATTLTVPTPTYDPISSDEEIFAECQSFSDQPVPVENDINRSIHWDTVLSNVTSSNLENIDSTTEHVESNLDLDAHQEFAVDSGNENINTTNYILSAESEAECIKNCSSESANATLEIHVEDNDHRNPNTTNHLLSTESEAECIKNCSSESANETLEIHVEDNDHRNPNTTNHLLSTESEAECVKNCSSESANHSLGIHVEDNGHRNPNTTNHLLSTESEAECVKNCSSESANHSLGIHVEDNGHRNPNTTNLLLSTESEAECVKNCSSESANHTLEIHAEDNDQKNLNKTVDLKSLCRQAILISDDDNLDVTSSVVNHNSFDNKTHELLNEINDLSETITLPPSQLENDSQKSNDNIELNSADDKVTSSVKSNSEIVSTEIACGQAAVEEVISTCAEEVKMLEKRKTEFTDSIQGDEVPTKSSVDTQPLKKTEEVDISTSSKKSLNLNQKVNIPTDNMSKDDVELVNETKNKPESRLPSMKNRKGIPSLQKSKYATYRIQKRTEKPDSLEELNQDSNKNEELLHNTFALGSEADVDTPLADKTFDAIQLNGTFDAKTPNPILNEIMEIASFDDNADNKVVSIDNALAEDMSKTIVVNKVDSIDDFFEPMEIDIDSPKESETASVKNISNTERNAHTQEIFMDNLTNAMNVTFKAPSTTAPIGKRRSFEQPTDSDFEGHGIILNPSDFDFLLTKGNNSVQIDDRSSLLLRFDPLVGHSVPVNQTQINNQNQIAQIISPQHLGRLSPAVEEDEESQNPIYHRDTPQSAKEKKCHANAFNSDLLEKQANLPTGKNIKTEKISNSPERQPLLTRRFQNISRKNKNDDKMSAEIIQGIKIENDSKTDENLSQKFEEKEEYKMDDLEKKIKNEVLKTEDIEKKLKDAEQREEALLKRITEKDKSISKMSGVIEAYEKAIAELIAEKEQIIQNYEKQMSEIKSERDRNYQHLTSLETTFSDLHVKYERSKQLTAKLKASEEELKNEKKQNLENLRLQEQRYEKMKNHAIQQLDIANNKLESLSKNHTMEVTRLKALLKKEEISRLSINEQLQQKTRENEELMKICDELINSQGASS